MLDTDASHSCGLPEYTKVFLVDVPEFLRRIVPDELIHDAVAVSHDVQDIYGEAIKFDIARHLLSLYRDQARLVITTQLALWQSFGVNRFPLRDASSCGVKKNIFRKLRIILATRMDGMYKHTLAERGGH